MRLAGSASGRRSAKHLRQQMTPPEIALWQALRGDHIGVRFRRQQPAGDYVLDFYCTIARLAIEVDGEAHERGTRPLRDAARDAWLVAHGVRVLRYPARDVLADLDAVVRDIAAALSERIEDAAHRSPASPSDPLRGPPPPGGGG